MKDTALLSAGHSGTWEKVAQDTTIVMAPNAGHFVQFDAKDLVNATIRNWLDMHPAR
jgi:pimeloyl-ACP methyl ester carboxylesterase